MESTVLEVPSDSTYLVQVSTDRHEVMGAISKCDLMAEIRRSLADKIAQKLFEEIGPVIMKALRES
ncbi:hypothetical protein LCGC14_2002580, partial [marine sediment metagenome]